jgi:hypothetical protein
MMTYQQKKSNLDESGVKVAENYNDCWDERCKPHHWESRSFAGGNKNCRTSSHLDVEVDTTVS